MAETATCTCKRRAGVGGKISNQILDTEVVPDNFVGKMEGGWEGGRWGEWGMCLGWTATRTCLKQAQVHV